MKKREDWDDLEWAHFVVGLLAMLWVMSALAGVLIGAFVLFG